MRFLIRDGMVAVENGGDLYIESAEKFALDHGSALPSLPPGMASMEADGAGRVVFYDAKQNAFPAPGAGARDAFADAAMANAARLKSARIARESAAKT